MAEEAKKIRVRCHIIHGSQGGFEKILKNWHYTLIDKRIIPDDVTGDYPGVKEGKPVPVYVSIKVRLADGSPAQGFVAYEDNSTKGNLEFGIKQGRLARNFEKYSEKKKPPQPQIQPTQ